MIKQAILLCYAVLEWGLIYEASAQSFDSDCVLDGRKVKDEVRPLFAAGGCAKSFSARNNGVGIVITYGAFDGAPTADQIGIKYVELFRQKGMPAQYFIVPNDVPGVAVAYHILDVVIGPFGAMEAVERIPEAKGLLDGGLTR